VERYKDVAKDILVERAKELECLYLIDEALSGTPFPDVIQKVAEAIPVGFRNMASCIVTIELDGKTYHTKPITGPADEMQSPILIDGAERGCIKIAYPKGTFPQDDPVFLEQEHKLVRTIAARISESIARRSIQESGGFRSRWKAIVELLQKTDNETLLYVCSRMIALLSRTNPDLLSRVYREMGWEQFHFEGEVNSPLAMLPDIDVIRLSDVLFESASTYLHDEMIHEKINLWIYQGKTYETARIVNKRDSDLSSTIKALKKYTQAVKASEGANEATNRWLKVELIRRFLTDNPASITNAQRHIRIEAFCGFLESYIGSPGGIGKIGGKGTGLFIAHQIIDANRDKHPHLSDIRMPRTWYISSKELHNLIDRNDLDELHEHKYKDIEEIRATYPRIIQMLKSLRFSSYINDALGDILDACPDKPLIVRSSSLLEDQIGTSFSGKYKSLFIPNTGTKAERRRQLTEGILEVYASIYNPDSIQYRKERNLLDYFEQMGILIQEVVGRRVGPYFFPLYAGLAFSSNELRWSPRIRREDGLVRMVMGLGTRAVDRVGDDFPILVSPGQPGLRVNQTPLEIKKYSPQMIDAIDLEKKQFVTLPITQLLKEYGEEIPHIDLAASVLKHDVLAEVNAFTSDFSRDDFVITFDGLIRKTPLLAKIRELLSVLKENLGYPVDIEFAGDGEHFYLLQCRPQSRSRDDAPAAIPADIPRSDTVFTANRYISNGRVTGIKTVVYVDPGAYVRLQRHEDYLRTGRAISELNGILPRRSFILMGPGRWGSRGDIKLGVPVAYSDINNTAALIEIASKELKSQPELSFGTHFFQDLVEENIKYLPLYPEDEGVIFSESFFTGTRNAFASMVPAYADLAHVIKVIQIGDEFYDKELILLMNADLEKAVAFLGHPSDYAADPADAQEYEPASQDEDGWRWRHYMAERIAEQMDMEAFSVKGIYLFGSTNTCTAKLNSDIDLLIHTNAAGEQKQALDTWLRGWSLALSEINYLKTGYRSNGLLDIHYVTDQDIADKTSYAVKINSVYDPAYPLRVREK